MRKYKINANPVHAIEHLYDNTISVVQMNGSEGECFRTTVGVRLEFLVLSTFLNSFSRKDCLML